MKNQKRIAKFCSLLSLTLLMGLVSYSTAYAGSINGNEQSIVSVIYGQFEQNGVVYKVRQEYINSALSYLQQDDVDLTSEQAQSVISEIYSNVQTGVESGYLEAIGGVSPEQTPPADSQQGQTGNAGEGNGTDRPNEGSTNGDGKTGEKTSNGEDLAEGEDTQIPEESDNGTPEGNGENEGESGIEPSETDTEITIPKTPAVISILELVDKAPPQTYDYLSRDTNALMQQIHIPYETITYGICLLAVITAVIAAISFWKKLLVHHHHRKLRKFLKYILTMETAVLSSVCLIIGGVWIGAFQDGAVLNKLSDTGYYRTIYEDLKRDTSVSFALLDIPDDLMDESITYERVVMAARQQVESDLSQGAYQVDTEMLTEELEGTIRNYLEGKSVTMTEQAEVGLSELMDRLNQKYSSLLQWPFASWWVNLKIEFFSFVKFALPGALVLLIISQLLIVFLNHYKHRGIALCGRGILAGGLLTAIAFGCGFAWMRESTPQITPEYMDLFFRIYENGILRVGIILGGIGVLLGLIYLVTVRTWKDGKQ